MGKFHALEYAKRFNKAMGLRAHLELDFYPPIDMTTLEIIIINFKGYWRDRFSSIELLNNINKDLEQADGKIIHLKSLDKFAEFLNEENFNENH